MVFIAVPKFSAGSLVVSIACAKKAAVPSKLIPADAAIEAVLCIAVPSSSVFEAVFAAKLE